MKIPSFIVLGGSLVAALGLWLGKGLWSHPRELSGGVSGGMPGAKGPAPSPSGKDPARPVPKILQQIAADKPVEAWQPGYEGLCGHDFERWCNSSVPELLVLRDLVRRWGVPERIVYSTVRDAYQAISARKMYTEQRESLLRKIQNLGKTLPRPEPDGILPPSDAGMDEATKERNLFMADLYARDLQEALKKYEKRIRDHTGITDPEFYRQLFALTPRTDSIALDTDGWIKAGVPGAYD